MSQIPPSVDSLPKQFVLAMRSLFDIMDDKKTGYVKLTDIRDRWRDDRTRGLPKGVIESLQTFASSNGLLTFDRFCAGLNLCLLRNQNEMLNRKHEMHSGLDDESVKSHTERRPPPAPLPAAGCAPAEAEARRAAPGPPRADPGARGQLLRYGPLECSTNLSSQTSLYGPPKPPRAEKPPKENNSVPNFPSKEPWFVREDVGDEAKSAFSSNEGVISRGRGPGDGKPAPAPGPGDPPPPALPHKSRRREPRRHTLQNGIDYNVLKRMKQIEQEKDILVQGLSAVEMAREWYLKELGEVQEKMKYVSRMGTHVEPWTEAHQERLELQRARVGETSRQLAALAEGWRRGGLSLHMNLALPPRAAPALLQHQNRVLREEVTKMNERLSVLEREKSALIRELLVLTDRNKNNDENLF